MHINSAVEFSTALFSMYLSICGTRHLCRLSKASSFVDRGHSLRSLHLPLAALPSLPGCLHNISFSFSAEAQSLPCAKGGGCPQGRRRDCLVSTHRNPPVSSADSPLYTRGPFPVPTIILQITMLLFVKGEDLYCVNLLFGENLF